MARPHTCPRCEGEQRIYSARSGQSESCPTCRGSGVVWEHDAEESRHDQTGQDALDLTYTATND